MLEYFPQLMEGLFKLLGDEHREIRQVLSFLCLFILGNRRYSLFFPF